MCGLPNFVQINNYLIYKTRVCCKADLLCVDRYLGRSITIGGGDSDGGIVGVI